MWAVWAMWARVHPACGRGQHPTQIVTFMSYISYTSIIIPLTVWIQEFIYHINYLSYHILQFTRTMILPIGIPTPNSKFAMEGHVDNCVSSWTLDSEFLSLSAARLDRYVYIRNRIMDKYVWPRPYEIQNYILCIYV